MAVWRYNVNQSRVLREDEDDFESVNQSPISNFELPPSGDLSAPEPSILTGDSRLRANRPADPAMGSINFVNGTISEGFTLEDHETDTIILNC